MNYDGDIPLPAVDGMRTGSSRDTVVDSCWGRMLALVRYRRTDILVMGTVRRGPSRGCSKPLMLFDNLRIHPNLLVVVGDLYVVRARVARPREPASQVIQRPLYEWWQSIH